LTSPGRRPRVITVLTHQYPDETEVPIKRLIDAAVEAGVEVRIPEEEVRKHDLEEREGCRLGAAVDGDVDLAVVLGGDGTILRALREYAGTDVPVFAFNYGAIGFLSTVDPDELEEGIARALEGRYDLWSMPALSIRTSEGRRIGVNDISFHRRPDSRVAELGYSIAAERLGQVRCDGLVASTPVGSTGYNLANGGPVLAWGVEGFVVSFIAPHTLTARALVVAPSDPLSVINLSDRDPVEITTDGRPVDQLRPGDEVEIRFEHDQVLIAQIPGVSFYHRLREKFGRLAY
jgi:NAD+ kinase